MKNEVLTFNKVYLNEASSFVGKKEYEGPLGTSFDAFEKDEYFGCKNFEEAESEMVRRNINLLLSKAQFTTNDIDILFGGDLINQCTVSSYSISDTKIPFIGLYGACSTFIEGAICSSSMIESGFAERCINFASSHFCATERQYRFPLEYGSTRTPTSQNTVTGTGALLLSTKKSNIKIKHAVIGRIIDKGVTDSNNMGAAMACAAADTIKRFFDNTNYMPNHFDIIATGDLGVEGHSICNEILNMENLCLGHNFTDCGKIIYDPNTQDTHAGGSGCGCIASVVSGHFIKKMKENKIKNLLAIGTGALLNPNSVFQKRTIPAIAHAIHFSTEE